VLRNFLKTTARSIFIFFNSGFVEKQERELVEICQEIKANLVNGPDKKTYKLLINNIRQYAFCQNINNYTDAIDILFSKAGYNRIERTAVIDKFKKFGLLK
jgi:hypothetical protein